jgi:hypothetical protein
MLNPVFLTTFQTKLLMRSLSEILESLLLSYGSFTWWLPLLLDEGHARRAMPLLKCILSALAANPLGTPPRTKEELMTVAFRPEDVFQVIKLTRLRHSALETHHQMLVRCILYKTLA